MKRPIIVLGCLLLASPILAQSAGEKTGVNSKHHLEMAQNLNKSK